MHAIDTTQTTKFIHALLQHLHESGATNAAITMGAVQSLHTLMSFAPPVHHPSLYSITAHTIEQGRAAALAVVALQLASAHPIAAFTSSTSPIAAATNPSNSSTPTCARPP